MVSIDSIGDEGASVEKLMHVSFSAMLFAVKNRDSKAVMYIAARLLRGMLVAAKCACPRYL